MIRYRLLDNFDPAHQPLPGRGSEQAAGIDLSAAEPATLHPGDSVWIRTGLAFEIPAGCFGAVRSRSGLRRDHRIISFDGTIDPDYRGELLVNLVRDVYEAPAILIQPGQRIAQLIIIPCSHAAPVRVELLGETARGNNGFGSTGR